MSTTGVDGSCVRNSATIASTSRSDTPLRSARSDERWITGPSAIGSENGTPSSITSAPALTSACRIGTVCEGAGSPAVTKGMRALRRFAPSDRPGPSPRPSPEGEGEINFSKALAMRLISERDAGGLGDGVHVLVAAAGEVHEEDPVARHRGRDLHRIRDRVARFQRRDDALQAAERMEGLERLVVGDRHVLRASGVLEPGVLGAHAGIVEAGG